jgi:hypothetical protein
MSNGWASTSRAVSDPSSGGRRKRNGLWHSQVILRGKARMAARNDHLGRSGRWSLECLLNRRSLAPRDLKRGRTPRWVPENAYELRKSDLKVRREMQAEVEKGWPEKP